MVHIADMQLSIASQCGRVTREPTIDTLPRVASRPALIASPDHGAAELCSRHRAASLPPRQLWPRVLRRVDATGNPSL